MGLREQFHATRAFDDQPQRDRPDDCEELTRAEMRGNKCIITHDFADDPQQVRAYQRMQAQGQMAQYNNSSSSQPIKIAPVSGYYGFRDPPQPAPVPYPGTISYPIMYGICAALAIAGVGGLWWMLT